MRKEIKILLVFIIGLFTFATNVFAEVKNEVTLNFGNGIIHNDYVEYSDVGKLQLFKGDDLVTDISNNMVIDLNGAEYKFVIQEIEDTSVSGANKPIKLNINNWYYPMTTIVGEAKSTFKLESSKFNGTLDVKLVRTSLALNTKIENIYNDIKSKGIIDLSGGKEYVIDFSKNDELTEGLKSFADLDKTLYYKRDNKALLATAVNVGTKKSEIFKGFHMQYTGSAIDYDDNDGGIILETRYDYYTRCTYEFTFQYVKEEAVPKEYKFIDGANQIYTIDESKNAIFRIDADFSLFDGKVYIDGALIDDKNFKAESGSTIITLFDEYLKMLAVGKHTIKFVFNDGGEATTNFEIKVKEIENTEEKNDNLENITNPDTGDNLVMSIVLGVSSLVLLLGIVIFLKKRSVITALKNEK